MDETILYIVIFVVWLIFQALGSKKKKKRPVIETPTTTPNAEPTLDDALREIRQALGMEAPATAAPPPRQDTPLPVPRPLPAPRPKAASHPVRSHGPELADMAPKKSWSSEFKAHPTHYADSDFEELATEGDRFGQAKKPQKPLRPAAKTGTTRQLSVERTKPVTKQVGRSKVMALLNNPQAAREAFILSEVLGAPRAHKRF